MVLVMVNDEKLALRVPSRLLDAIRERAEVEERSVSQVARMSLASVFAGELSDVRIADGDATAFEERRSV